MVTFRYPRWKLLVYIAPTLLFYTHLLASQVIVTRPLYETILRQLTENVCTCDKLIHSTAHTHDSSLTHKDAERISEANIWFITGEPCENALSEQLKDFNVLKVNINKNMKNILSEDIHFWLSPKRLLSQVSTMLEALKETFPKSSEQLESNFEKICDQILSTQLLLDKASKNIKGETLLLTHGVLGYFCQEFGLKQMALDTHGQEPSLKHINECLSDDQSESPLILIIIEGHYEEMGYAVAEQLKIPTFLLNPDSEKIIDELRRLGEALTEVSYLNEKQKNDD